MRPCPVHVSVDWTPIMLSQLRIRYIAESEISLCAHSRRFPRHFSSTGYSYFSHSYPRIGVAVNKRTLRLRTRVRRVEDESAPYTCLPICEFVSKFIVEIMFFPRAPRFYSNCDPNTNVVSFRFRCHTCFAAQSARLTVSPAPWLALDTSGPSGGPSKNFDYI
jgi:hypothetical protein